MMAPLPRRNYPASYPGVIAVTSVDSANRLELDANRTNTAFAALGVDVRAASLPAGYSSFTGTSYAAPAVTSRFAVLLPKPDVAAARTTVDAVAHASAHLRGPGSQPLYLVGPPVLSAAATQ